MKSILDICCEVADLAAVKRPDDLFDTTSQQNSVFLSVVKSALDSLLRYGDWPELTKEGVLRTSSGRENYLIDEICPDFFSLLNNTVYIKDLRERVVGAITPQEWMKEKYFYAPSCAVKFKLQNGMIKFLTPPPDDLQVVFQYRSNAVCLDNSGYTEKSTVTANSDIPIFDAYLVKLGIWWRWLKRNGMDYTEEFAEYERELKKRFGSTLATHDIDLSGGIENFGCERNGIYVSAHC
jgi:hypothetical protein